MRRDRAEDPARQDRSRAAAAREKGLEHRPKPTIWRIFAALRETGRAEVLARFGARILRLKAELIEVLVGSSPRSMPRCAPDCDPAYIDQVLADGAARAQGLAANHEAVKDMWASSR